MVALRWTGGTHLARLLEVGTERTVLQFRDDPALCMGETVKVMFSAKGNRFRHDTTAVIVSRSAAGRYEVAFSDVAREQQELLPELNRIFNRRRFFRLHRDPEKLISVGLGLAFGVSKWQGTMVDLSRGGMALYVDVGIEQRLRRTEMVYTQWRLPNSSGGIQLPAAFRSRELDQPMVRYGLEFMEENTPTFSRQVAAIADFVDRAHRAQLAQAAP